MTVQLFLVMFTIGSAVSSLLTEAIKNVFINKEKEASPNVIAAVDSIVVGVLGTMAYYIINGIEFTVTNIIYMFLMAAAIWVASMVGYDKVMQLIAQLTGGEIEK